MSRSDNSDQADISDTTTVATDNSKEEIIRKLATRQYTLTKKIISESQTSSQSTAWQFFNQIVDGDGCIIKGFVSCLKCYKVLKHDSKITGTSSLNRHVKKCRQTSSTVTVPISRYLKPSSSDTDYKVPNNAEKEFITNKCVEYVCKDLRSFKSLNGKGFLALAQSLINIGAEKGKLDAANLIPHPTTVSRQVNKLAEPLRKVLYKKFKTALKTCGGAITLDLWTDNYRKIDYLCLTCHFITKDWCLHSKVLCTTEWDSTKRKTGDQIWQKVVNILTHMGFYEFCNNIVFVTDRGTNLVAALRTETRLDCSAHVLNTVLSTIFSSCEPLVADMVVAAKRLVQYFKQTGLQKRLKTTLKAQVETRWNTMYDMFESISSNYDNITSLLAERRSESHLENIPLDYVNSLVDFLLAFTAASKDIQQEIEPTLHSVVAWIKILQVHMKPDETDSAWIANLKILGLQTLPLKFHLNMLHKVAFFLNPHTKALTAIEGDVEIPALYDKIRTMVLDVIARETNIQSQDVASTSSQLPAPIEPTIRETNPRKRKRFSVLDVADKLPEQQDKDEVQKYIDLYVPEHKENEKFDILKWWEEHSKIFPYLSQVARFILCIPASSAPSERDFSNAGFVLQPRRSKLNPVKVDDILFLHSNL